MKKLILGIALLSVACTQGPGQHEKNVSQKQILDKKLEKPTYQSGEFVFKGDKALVSKYLNTMGLSHQFFPILEAKQLFQVRYTGGTEVKEVISGLKGELAFIEPNYLNEHNYETNKRKWANDKFFFKQWYMNNIGQSAPFGLPGVRGGDVNVLSTWDSGAKGSKEVVVAVIDTGIDYKHEDLKDSMWTNDKELNGHPGVDDDGNGFYDDIYGFDFSSAGRTDLWYTKIGDADPMDENGHGTHCAGVIGAKPNNSVGIAGLNHNVKLMALKIFPDNGGATNADIAKAIYYGIDKKVDIMSNSYGGTSNSELISQAVSDANAAGILFVVASGNDGTNNDIAPKYPSSTASMKDATQRLPNVLSVGASDNQDNPAEFSNYGHQSVDVFAPGVLIMSTYPTQLVDPGKPPYAIMSGTSMATPIVSGVAALVLAANPSLKGKPDELRRVIIESSDVKQSLVGKSVSNGRINTANAVKFLSDKTQKLSEWQTKSYPINQRGHNKELFDIRHKIQVEGARAIRAHFDFVQINEPYDSVYFYDKNMRYISSMDKTETVSVWSPVVPGDTIYIRYVNSKLKKLKSKMALNKETESACSSAGGVMVEKGNAEVCMMDSTDSSGDDGEIFNSFISEGFSVDKISYVN